MGRLFLFYILALFIIVAFLLWTQSAYIPLEQVCVPPRRRGSSFDAKRRRARCRARLLPGLGPRLRGGTPSLVARAYMPTQSGAKVVTESPFVKMFASAGIPYAARIMNFVVAAAALAATVGGLGESALILSGAGYSVSNPPASSIATRTSIPHPSARFAATKSAIPASGTRWTMISSPSTPPPSPTLVRSFAIRRVKLSLTMPGEL